MEHKHAEVLRAIADGKEVQFKDGNGVWVTLFDANPIMQSSWEWRVKPEPKPDYFLYTGFDRANTDSGCTELRNFTTTAWKYWIKITIDGETKKPKSVELVK